jgi:hypothetical protein
MLDKIAGLKGAIELLTDNTIPTSLTAPVEPGKQNIAVWLANPARLRD